MVVVATLRPASVVRFLVWQPAFSLYVLLGSLGLALGRTRSAGPLVIVSPALFNRLFWLGMATGPHFRFQWPVVLLAPLAACLSALDIWFAVAVRAADVERCTRQGANIRSLSGRPAAPDSLRRRLSVA